MISTEEEYNQYFSKTEIPKYLYVCLDFNKKIPSEEELVSAIHYILTVDEIRFDFNQYGIPIGIFIYFSSVNLNSIGDLLNDIKYSGSFNLSIIFHHMNKCSYENYHVIADKKYRKDVIDKESIIAKPKLKRNNLSKENDINILEIKSKIYEIEKSISAINNKLHIN